MNSIPVTRAEAGSENKAASLCSRGASFPVESDLLCLENHGVGWDPSQESLCFVFLSRHFTVQSPRPGR